MVSYYEIGKVAPRADTLAKIAEFGNVTYEWLYTGKNPDMPVVAEPLNTDYEAAMKLADEIKDIPEPLLTAIKQGKNLSAANALRVAADILDKIGDRLADEEKKKEPGH
jgi:transcriptional regulator with XRE-family HTH domain